jgi:hypothetical protein
MTSRVEWSRRATDSHSHRVVASLLAGGGLVVLLAAVGALAAFVGRAVAAGDLGVVAAVVVLTLVGGPFSLLYLVPILSDEEVRERLSADGLVGAIEPRWMGVGAVGVGGLVLAVAVLAVPPTLVLGAVLVPGALYMSLTGEGAVDPSGPTVETSEREAPVDGLTGFRTATLGDTVFVWLSYARGRGWPAAPRLLVVPRSAAPDVREALDAIGDPDAEPRPPAGGEQRVVVAAGVACLVGAAGAVLLPLVTALPRALLVGAVPLAVTGAALLAVTRLE